MLLYVANITNPGEVLKVDTEARTAQSVATFNNLTDMAAFLRTWNPDGRASDMTEAKT